MLSSRTSDRTAACCCQRNGSRRRNRTREFDIRIATRSGDPPNNERHRGRPGVLLGTRDPASSRVRKTPRRVRPATPRAQQDTASRRSPAGPTRCENRTRPPPRERSFRRRCRHSPRAPTCTHPPYNPRRRIQGAKLRAVKRKCGRSRLQRIATLTDSPPGFRPIQRDSHVRTLGRSADAQSVASDASAARCGSSSDSRDGSARCS